MRASVRGVTAYSSVEKNADTSRPYASTVRGEQLEARKCCRNPSIKEPASERS
jgi:hypothetical protein